LHADVLGSWRGAVGHGMVRAEAGSVGGWALCLAKWMLSMFCVSCGSRDVSLGLTSGMWRADGQVHWLPSVFPVCPGLLRGLARSWILSHAMSYAVGRMPELQGTTRAAWGTVGGKLASVRCQHAMARGSVGDSPRLSGH
jgi:hypothetical protein